MTNLKSLLLLLLLIGCLNSQDDQGYDFGSAYDLVTTAELPAIEGHSLITRISYGGCNAGHNFRLKKELSEETARLWLFKQTPDQLCEMLVQERKSFKLDNNILDAQRVIILRPNGNPITLK